MGHRKGCHNNDVLLIHEWVLPGQWCPIDGWVDTIKRRWNYKKWSLAWGLDEATFVDCPFYFMEQFKEGHCQFFFQGLPELTSESIWVWDFPWLGHLYSPPLPVLDLLKLFISHRFNFHRSCVSRNPLSLPDLPGFFSMCCQNIF